MDRRYGSRDLRPDRSPFRRRACSCRESERHSPRISHDVPTAATPAGPVTDRGRRPALADRGGGCAPARVVRQEAERHPGGRVAIRIAVRHPENGAGLRPCAFPAGGPVACAAPEAHSQERERSDTRIVAEPTFHILVASGRRGPEEEVEHCGPGKNRGGPERTLRPSSPRRNDGDEQQQVRQRGHGAEPLIDQRVSRLKKRYRLSIVVGVASQTSSGSSVVD